MQNLKLFKRKTEFLLMQRANRIKEELRDRTAQLERAVQQTQSLTGELSHFFLEEAKKIDP